MILLITSAKGGPSAQGGPSTPQPEAAVVLKLAARVVVYKITTKLSKIKQGHQELSGKSDENNPLKPNQSVPSIYIMIEICYFSLDQ